MTMGRDTLPLHQTISIFSMLLMVVAISLTTYSITNSFWMHENLSVKTVYIGIELNRTLPSKDDLIPDASEKNCGGALQNLAETLGKNQNGLLYLDGQIGLKDFCIYIRVKHFGPITELLPRMHYCRSYDTWEDYGQKRLVTDKGTPMSKKLFDDAIDVADEVYDLMTASLSIMAIATFSVFLKTPLMTNMLKSRKIFHATSFILVLSAVIVTTWGIMLFAFKCDPETLILTERQRQIKAEKAKEIWLNVRTNQSLGKCFYIAISADCILVLVLILSVIEYRLGIMVAYHVHFGGIETTEERLLSTDYERED